MASSSKCPGNPLPGQCPPATKQKKKNHQDQLTTSGWPRMSVARLRQRHDCRQCQQPTPCPRLLSTPQPGGAPRGRQPAAIAEMSAPSANCPPPLRPLSLSLGHPPACPSSPPQSHGARAPQPCCRPWCRFRSAGGGWGGVGVGDRKCCVPGLGPKTPNTQHPPMGRGGAAAVVAAVILALCSSAGHGAPVQRIPLLPSNIMRHQVPPIALGLPHQSSLSLTVPPPPPLTAHLRLRIL